MRAQLLATAALMAAFFVSGCSLLPPIQGPGQPGGTATPSPVATQPGQEAPTPTPTPPPVLTIEPGTRGHAVLDHSGLERLPFGWSQWEPGALDYWVLATLMDEKEDNSLPVVELSLRGNLTAPCLSGDCDTREDHPLCDLGTGAYVRSPGRCWKTALVGLWLRYSGNLAYEGQGEPFFGACGFTKEHKMAARQAIPADSLSRGILRSELQWEPGLIRYRAQGLDWSPWLHLKHPRALRLSHVENGVPGRGVGFSRPDWSAALRGVQTRVISWEASEAESEQFRPCP